jgi:hypothetical protein
MHDFFVVARSSSNSMVFGFVAVVDEAKKARITERPNSFVMTKCVSVGERWKLRMPSEGPSVYRQDQGADVGRPNGFR